jgi:hypothetical protein
LSPRSPSKLRSVLTSACRSRTAGSTAFALRLIRQPQQRTCGRGWCAGIVREPVYTPPRNAPRRAHTLRAPLGSSWNASKSFAPGRELLTDWSLVRVRPGELKNQGVSEGADSLILPWGVSGVQWRVSCPCREAREHTAQQQQAPAQAGHRQLLYAAVAERCAGTH